jgi:hypothetical protein
MKILLAAAFLSGFVATTGAHACRTGVQSGFPIRSGSYDAVALATVVRQDEDSSELRYEMVFEGHVDAPTGSIPYGAPPGMLVVRCGLPGPSVTPGAQVVVILNRRDGIQVVTGWWPPQGLRAVEDFFALYLAERGPEARRRLQARWREVVRFGGPVPMSDPTRWMGAHSGSLGWSGLPGLSGRTTARFNLNNDGLVTSCEMHPSSPPHAEEASICRMLRRQRFQRPMLRREREGWYEVRWDQPAASVGDMTRAGTEGGAVAP